MALKEHVKVEQVLILPHLNTQEILHAEFEKLVMEFYWKNYSWSNKTWFVLLWFAVLMLAPSLSSYVFHCVLLKYVSFQIL